MAAGNVKVEPGKLIQALRERRAAEGLTLEWVADRLGVSTALVGHWESGRNSPPEPRLRRWLKVLDMPEELADEWLEYRIEEEIARALGSRRGPRAMPQEDIDAIRRIIRRSWGR